MKFEPSLPRDGVNVSKTRPLRELAALLLGLLFAIALVVLAIGAVVDRLVVHLPPSLEATLFGNAWSDDFDDATETPRLGVARDLVARLARRWPDNPYDFRVTLWQDEDPNALALPGGQVVVSSGLLEEAESENELAFVLGHELGHFRHRDHLRGLGRGLVVRAAMAAIGAGAAGGLAGAVADLGNRSFDREQELAADHFGFELVAAEYGHVNGAPDFFRDRAEAAGRGRWAALDAYTSTHPAFDERIEALHELAAERGWPEEGRLSPLR